jgi:hypothetical protein
MYIEILLLLITLITCIFGLKLLISKINHSYLQEHFPLIFVIFSYFELMRIERKIQRNQNIQNKLQYYFPVDKNDEQIQEKTKILEWFLTQSKEVITIIFDDNTNEMWDVNTKYNQFINTFYYKYGIYPSLNEDYLIGDHEIQLQWDNYSNTVEWSQVAIYIWLIENCILDYFDDNYDLIEKLFYQKSNSNIKMIDEQEEDTLEEDIQEKEDNLEKEDSLEEKYKNILDDINNHNHDILIKYQYEHEEDNLENKNIKMIDNLEKDNLEKDNLEKEKYKNIIDDINNPEFGESPVYVNQNDIEDI